MQHKPYQVVILIMITILWLWPFRHQDHLILVVRLKVVILFYIVWRFLGKPLTQFVSSCAENYLTSEHKTIRLEAVKTCASLLVPTLQPVSILTSSHATSSASSTQIVSDILAQLLQVAITDPGKYTYVRAFVTVLLLVHLYFTLLYYKY